jgi:hypothetical protein
MKEMDIEFEWFMTVLSTDGDHLLVIFFSLKVKLMSRMLVVIAEFIISADNFISG